MKGIFVQFFIFLFYSFIGWICETVFCSLAARRFINRGFLSGPFCPIYGFGAMIVLLLFSNLQGHIVPLFVCSMLGASALEYITSFLLEKIFHLSLWDYSDRKWNLHGRVCLRNSLLFGLMSVLMVQVIHPHMIEWLNRLPTMALILGFAFLAIYFICDTATTVLALVEISRAAGERQLELEGLSALREQYMENAQKERRRKKLLRKQRMYRRLARAFPRMKSLRNPEAFRELLEEAQARMNHAASRLKRLQK